MSTNEEDLFLAAATHVADLTEEDLSAVALSVLNDHLPPGYSGKPPADRVREWIESGFVKSLRSAGAEGGRILALLNDEKVRADVHLVAVVAAYVGHHVVKSEVPVEAVTALALLVVRHYERRRS